MEKGEIFIKEKQMELKIMLFLSIKFSCQSTFGPSIREACHMTTEYWGYQLRDICFKCSYQLNKIFFVIQKSYNLEFKWSGENIITVISNKCTFCTAGSSEYDGGPGQILSLGVPSS